MLDHVVAENNALSGDMFSLDRKVKQAKENGEDITSILNDNHEILEKDREKMNAACNKSPDTSGFSRDEANQL